MLGGLLLLFVLVPFGLYEEPIARWTQENLRGAHSKGIVAAIIGGLLALDIVLPVPSSLVSVASGALLGFGKGAMVSWAGMSLGCIIGYGLGRGVARRPVQRLVNTRESETVSQLFARHGIWAIALCRAVPVLAEASVLLAGMFRMPFRQFALLTLASNLGLSLAYAAVGAFAVTAHSFLLAFAAALLLPLAATLLFRKFMSA